MLDYVLKFFEELLSVNYKNNYQIVVKKLKTGKKQAHTVGGRIIEIFPKKQMFFDFSRLYI